MAYFLLVDNEPGLLRTYQRILLEAGHVVATADNLTGARDVLTRTAHTGASVDAVLLDLSVGGEDGASLLPAVHELHPLAQVAVVSGHVDAIKIIELASHCALVIPKPLSRTSLLALAGELQARRARAPSLENLAREAHLSARETEIIHQAMAGKQTEEIAQELGSTPGSVKTYWNRIFAKTGCHSRLEVLSLLRTRPGHN